MAYKPGDVVIENDPFALAVLDKMIPMVCSWCLKPASKTSKKSPLSLCAGCKTLKYCSPACQKEDWSKGPHKKECKYLKNNKKHQMPVPNCKVRLIARIIFKLKAGLGDEEVELPNGKKLSYNSLIGHKDQLPSTDEANEEFAFFWKSFKLFLGHDANDLLDMFRVAYCKLMTTFNMDGQPVAEGLNLLASVVPHSCYPNCMASNFGRKLFVRSIGDIKKYSNISVAYYSPMFGQPRSVRRAMIMKCHNFHCRCDECEMVNPGASEREAIRDRPFRCASCRKRGYKLGQCLDCAALGTGEGIFMDHLDIRMQKQLESKRQALISDCIDPQLTWNLHPELWSHHCICMAFAIAVGWAQNGPIHLLHPAARAENWKIAERFGQLRLDHRKIICPPNHSMIAFGAIELGRVKAKLNKYTEANDLVKYAQGIWSISHGPDHPNYKNKNTIQDWMHALQMFDAE